jgi:hypothetical protein
VNQHDFEARVLELWMTTRIPLTRANVQFSTKAPRKRVEAWLDRMVAEGVLEVDADDEGEMIWSVRGAKRSTGGPETVAELAKWEGLRSEVRGAGSALTLASRAMGLSTTRRAGQEHKSIIASGALSLFFGPLGWLYAAPLREALPAIAIYLLALWLPFISVVTWMLLPFIHIVSGVAGAAYAWRFNQKGERAELVGDVKRALPSKRS